MNLRISNHQLRFRITRDELDLLLGGTILHLELDIGAQPLICHISTSDGMEPLNLSIAGNLWHLAVNKDALTNFAASLPTREGIEHEVQLGASPVRLMLEVDVRRKG